MTGAGPWPVACIAWEHHPFPLSSFPAPGPCAVHKEIRCLLLVPALVQARGLPTENLRPLFRDANIAVYAIQVSSAPGEFSLQNA